MVVAAFSSAANRTNRTRDQASTAQKTCTPASTPQSMTKCSPGDHTAGRRVGPASARQVFLSCATNRRKLRSDPVYPAARALGSNRLALIRPREVATAWATTSRTGS